MPIFFFFANLYWKTQPPKPGPWKADKKQLKQATAESHRIQKMFASVDQAHPYAESIIFDFNHGLIYPKKGGIYWDCFPTFFLNGCLQQ